MPLGTPRWSHRSGRCAALTGHSQVLSLAAVPTPDGRVLLASAGEDRTVQLWDPGTGQAVGDPLTGHAGPVWAVATVPMPDGRVLLASAGEDRAVRVWDPVTRQLVGRPLMMVEPVVSMVGFEGRLAVATGLAVCLLARPADAMC